MNIEIKRSVKPINYNKAIKLLEQRISNIINKNDKELIWILEHPNTYTGGTNYNKSEVLDKSITIIKTNRGGKITYHGPGQLVCYFAINLNKRKRDIRKFIQIIEKTIIQSLKEFGIDSFSDRNNVGIWVNHKNKTKKVAAIGIRIKKWVAYHGFSINIDTDLMKYNKIVPCGIKDKKVINLKNIKNQNYKKFYINIIKNFILNLKI